MSMMSVSAVTVPYVNPYPIPTLDEHLASIEEDERETLYICPNAWALRHRFVNRETGEMIRARCDSWRCLYCGPRKVDLWRQLVRAAEPVLFVTLTKVGWTVEEASRVLTTVMQRLRRGYRSRDPERKGYRNSYQIEYFAVLERHTNFEENGFHWHLLVKGVDFLPNEVVSDALCSATKGRSFITKVQRIRNAKAIGYVTKYLTKDITNEEKGVRVQEREMITLGLEPSEETTTVTYEDENGVLVTEERPYLYRVLFDDDGKPVEERKVCAVEVVSKARRIRYSRRFFPESVAALRARLFSEIKDNGEIGIDEAAVPAALPTDEMVVQQPSDPVLEEQEGGPDVQEEPTHSAWALVEIAPQTDSVEVYKLRKQHALREALEERRANGRRLNRRILSMWDYQWRERHERRGLRLVS